MNCAIFHGCMAHEMMLKLWLTWLTTLVYDTFPGIKFLKTCMYLYVHRYVPDIGNVKFG